MFPIEDTPGAEAPGVVCVQLVGQEHWGRWTVAGGLR